MRLTIPWRLSMTTARRQSANRSRRHWAALLVGAGLALLSSVPFTTAAAGGGGSSGSATLTIPVVVAVKSITLSFSSMSYGTCSGGTSTGTALGFPNGVCSTPQLDLTTGTAPSNVSIMGANAVPSDSGTNWVLCWPFPGAPTSTPTCAGSTDTSTGYARPGADSYAECSMPITESTGCDNTGPAFGGQEGVFSYQPVCDQAFNNLGTPISCINVPAQTTSHEFISITGPSSSSDASNSFTATVTWSVS
jgi:hypothetical protein